MDAAIVLRSGCLGLRRGLLLPCRRRLLALFLTLFLALLSAFLGASAAARLRVGFRVGLRDDVRLLDGAGRQGVEAKRDERGAG